MPVEKEAEMIELKQPDIAVSLALIHRIITRGLSVSMANSGSFARDGFPDAATQAGFTSYARALASLIHGHHLTEDEVAFPYFRDKLPDAPFDALSSDHRTVEAILHEVEGAVDRLDAGAQPGDALRDLNDAVTRLDRIWHPHIAKEEQHITTEAVSALIGPEEQGRLLGQFVEHTAQNSGPDYLVVPFMLFNLSADDRAEFSTVIPEMVTQQLVPVVWKEKWVPMQPFLLP
jgi:hypothetical protein